MIWATSLAEYGVVAAVMTKVFAGYSHLEASLRDGGQATWLFCGAVVLLGYWLVRRR